MRCVYQHVVDSASYASYIRLQLQWIPLHIIFHPDNIAQMTPLTIHQGQVGEEDTADAGMYR